MTPNDPGSRTCSRCGAELPPHTDECPRCLLRLGLGPERTPPPSGEGGSAGSRVPRTGPPPTLEEVRAAFPALEIEALIGQGGMGAVFRARQPKLARNVALKVLPRALGEDPDFAERFQREARALAKLSHPGIVAVHDFGREGGLHYLVMEYVEGVNLRALLRAGPLPPAQALAIARELCDALQYAHDEGVVHRDIKPENVLVDARGRVKVADFGLAKLVGAGADALLTRTDQVMGTPHYMAPEQMERPHEVDHRADLFALGVVLYEMLTGSLPRGAFEPPSQRVQVDVQLDRIVLKALEREPTRRYQAALEIRTDVDHVTTGAGKAAPRSAPASSGGSASGRPPLARKDGFFREQLGDARGWRAVGLFLVAWLLLGLSWNLGPFATGLGVVIVVAAAARALQAAVRADAAWLAALRALPRGERAARRVILSLGAFLAVFLVSVGHVLHWEKGTHTWKPTLHGADGWFEAWSRDPWSLLRFVAPEPERVQEFFPAEAAPRVVKVENFTSVPFSSTDRLDWILILGGFVVLALVFTATVHLRSSPELARKAWHLGGELASYSLVALVLLWMCAPIASLRTHEVLQEVTAGTDTQLGFESALIRVRSFLGKHAMAIEVEQNVEVVDGHTARVLAGATILRVARPDPFERWSTSLRGAVRETPQFWITLAPRADGEGTRLMARAGLLDPREPELEEAHALLDELVTALEP